MTEKREIACCQLNVKEASADQCKNAIGGIVRTTHVRCLLDHNHQLRAFLLWGVGGGGGKSFRSNPNALMVSQFTRAER